MDRAKVMEKYMWCIEFEDNTVCFGEHYAVRISDGDVVEVIGLSL